MSNVSQEELFSPDEHIRALTHSDSLPDDIENLVLWFITLWNPVDNALYIPADLCERKFCSGTHTFK